MNGGPSQVDTFDPKPALTKYNGQKPPAANIKTERSTGDLMQSPFKFKKSRQVRHRGQRNLPARRRVHRRHLRHPLDAHQRAQSRTVAADDDLRRNAADPAVDGFVAAVRPGHREPEPARLRRALSRASRWSGRNCGATVSCPASSRAHTSTTARIDPKNVIAHISNNYVRPSIAARAARLAQTTQRDAPRQARRQRQPAGGAHSVAGDGLPHAVRGAGGLRPEQGDQGYARPCTATARSPTPA